MSTPAEALEEHPSLFRILPRCEEVDGCWVWMGARSNTDYGIVRWEKRIWKVHRVVYTVLVGEIPDGLTLDHLCRNRPCCNPRHLEPVTNRVNILRGISPVAENFLKTHCDHGHELTEENTYPNGTGRACKTCSHERSAAWKKAHRSRVNEWQRRYRAPVDAG